MRVISSEARRSVASPAGSVGVFAYGKGVHRTPAPLRLRFTLHSGMRIELGYYGIAETKRLMDDWNVWLRRRIPMYIWKRWKKPRTRLENLKKLGMPEWQAYRIGNTRKGYWAIAGSGILTHTITDERLARRGYYDISKAYKSLHSF